MRRAPTKGEEIAEEIASRISRGRYRPGECLPGETSLSAEFGVTRKVVRAAPALLRERGLVETVAPKGPSSGSAEWSLP
ncbi:GntR family transcriptional regulator [Nonomuraea terrae]|uniref:GntR family transcriptional regulator n=1 Tax=Nonomuraea terrae TaxID=2530383 RepID=UPI001FE615E6|nr:GntR family transcriptional regulator [Nonomuraea terrae]